MIDWRKHIVSNEAVQGGRPTIKGTRISVEFILSLLANGWTVPQVLVEIPILSPSDVLACSSFAYEVISTLVDRGLHKRFLPVCNDPVISVDIDLDEETKP